MTLFDQEQLEQVIVRLLSDQPRLSAHRIKVLTARGGREFSQAAVYKELTQLQRRGVVVKDGIYFSLSLGWIFDVFTFSDQLSDTYFTESYLRTLLPDLGQRQRWRFNSLVRCNDFWNQLLLALLKHTRSSSVLSWVPHPWFLLLSSEQETRLQRAFTVSGRRFYTIFGGDPSRSELVKRFYTSKSQTYSFASSPMNEQEGTYLDVVGDYVLSVKMDTRTNRRIDNFFELTDDGSMSKVVDNFRKLLSKCQVTIRLEYNQKNAKRLRGIFAEYFGIR